VITGPQGVVLDFGMEIEARTPERVALDDEFLKELLVINSVIGGWIEAMLHKKQKAEKMPHCLLKIYQQHIKKCLV
jgi:hypothetical protein